MFLLQDMDTSSSYGEEVKSVVNTLSMDPEVVADGSRLYTIPTVPGKHNDLKAISPDTVPSLTKRGPEPPHGRLSTPSLPGSVLARGRIQGFLQQTY
ncbi:hypothetical protein MAR_011943, partial [Mya arenaria]